MSNPVTENLELESEFCRRQRLELGPTSRAAAPVIVRAVGLNEYSHHASIGQCSTLNVLK
jgi:hypothetical protein